ncbi:phosphoinositide phospholipase C, putative [Medicago truncatula]|uniref:Phosphoinositide phospholipase C, putative n=1 Tax=Medicago truncatula TaxID=3880 RepID=A0A072TMD3_MEDTR|nr:phosphoinositide phospholipase C, putative [Medicago truncatula]
MSSKQKQSYSICFCSRRRFKLSISEAPQETKELFQCYSDEKRMKLLPRSASSNQDPEVLLPVLCRDEELEWNVFAKKIWFSFIYSFINFICTFSIFNL